MNCKKNSHAESIIECDSCRMEHIIICPVRGNGILPGTGPGGTSEIRTVAGFEVRFFRALGTL